MDFGELPVCAFCSEGVDPRVAGTYRHIDGWVENRTSAGGANAVHLRTDMGEFAHKWCIEQRKVGVSQDQQLLF